MSSGGRGAVSRGNTQQSPTYAIQDLTRRINNLVRIGKVIDCDYENHKVRVQMGSEGRTQVTRWINWGSPRASHDRSSNALELGEQVVILCVSGRIESAMVVCSLRQIAHEHTTSDPNHHLDLFRILENTEYWFAKEERKFVGDVNPESKRANKEEQLPTHPPQDKLLDSDTETAEGIEYYYRNVIRPELLALMEYVAIVTQPNGEADLKLVANAMNNGTTKFFLESAVKGDGHAFGVTRVVSGDATYNEPTNPHKPVELNRTEGNAINDTYVAVESGNGEAHDTKTVTNKGNGNSLVDDTVEASNGDAVVNGKVKSSGVAKKTITIEGDGESELLITLKNTAHVKILVGEENQFIDLDGKNVVVNTIDNVTVTAGKTATVNCKDAMVDASANATVKAGSNATVEAGSKATVKGQTCEVVATGTANLKGAVVNVEASGALSLKGSAVTISGGTVSVSQG